MAAITNLRCLATAARSINQRSIHTTKTTAVTFTESGAVMPNPGKTKVITLLGGLAAMTIGIYTGGMISKNIAGWLEENELFVPSDDDDDD